MARKTISIDADLHAKLGGCKQDDESWTDLLERLHAAAEDAEPPDDAGECTACAFDAGVVDDIVMRSAERTADEIETRLR